MKKPLLTLLAAILAVGIFIALGYANVTTTDAVERASTFYAAVCCTGLIVMGATLIILLGD